MGEKILAATDEGQDRIQLQLSDVRIKEMLEEATDDIRMSAGKTCDIRLSVSPEELTARMDRKLMSSVISTLLDNAVKYSGTKPVINLKAYHSDGRLHIIVKDNGPGIAKEHRKHIFDKFYRIPTGDLHNVKGHGIGLHFAKTVVRKHSGTITVGVIVSDIMMPVMSGLEMVQQIRIQDKQTPVLMLTAKTQVNDVVEGFGAGANDYLRKPFAIPELVVRIRALSNRATLMADRNNDELIAGRFQLGINTNS